MVGTLSAWITEHQLAIAVAALGLILVTATATLLGRQRSHTAEDCCAPNAQPEENVDSPRGHPSN